MDFVLVANNLEKMVRDLEDVYAASLVDAVTIYGAAQWLKDWRPASMRRPAPCPSGCMSPA